jgi:L-lactate dehydrogenase
MKVAVWGAGTIGSELAYRLATTAFTSEIHWVNRGYERIAHQAIDLEHGLEFAPSCHRVEAYRQEDAARALRSCSILVLTLGAPVPKGARRADIYLSSRKIYGDAGVVSTLREFPGIVIVVTNPVDLMARVIHRGAALPDSRVIALGTLVETARLRASLGSYLSPMRPAREVWPSRWAPTTSVSSRS